jgi:mRNA interferase RelE/StbE
MESFRIDITEDAQKDLRKIPVIDQKKILAKINLLVSSPKFLDIKKLTGFKNYYRLRAGDYRVVFIKINEIFTIKIIKIKHRKEVYKDL